mgnify:CR=1 FL=1
MDDIEMWIEILHLRAALFISGIAKPNLILVRMPYAMPPYVVCKA